MEEMVCNELPRAISVVLDEGIVHPLVNGVFWFAFLEIS